MPKRRPALDNCKFNFSQELSLSITGRMHLCLGTTWTKIYRWVRMKTFLESSMPQNRWDEKEQVFWCAAAQYLLVRDVCHLGHLCQLLYQPTWSSDQRWQIQAFSWRLPSDLAQGSSQIFQILCLEINFSAFISGQIISNHKKVHMWLMIGHKSDKCDMRVLCVPVTWFLYFCPKIPTRDPCDMRDMRFVD